MPYNHYLSMKLYAVWYTLSSKLSILFVSCLLLFKFIKRQQQSHKTKHLPIEQAEFIAKLGFDYLEVSAAGLAEMTEAQFADFLQKNEAAPIHAEAANCMFPGSIKLTGDNVDFEAIQTYVNHAIGRLAQAGIKIGVFGSGGSRRVPENFPREKAWEQLKTVAKS